MRTGTVKCKTAEALEETIEPTLLISIYSCLCHLDKEFDIFHASFQNPTDILWSLFDAVKLDPFLGSYSKLRSTLFVAHSSRFDRGITTLLILLCVHLVTLAHDTIFNYGTQGAPTYRHYQLIISIELWKKKQ